MIFAGLCRGSSAFEIDFFGRVRARSEAAFARSGGRIRIVNWRHPRRAMRCDFWSGRRFRLEASDEAGQRTTHEEQPRVSL